MSADGEMLIQNSAGTAPKANPLEQAEHGDREVLLERLLFLAHQYRKEGKVHEAMDLYWKLAEEHAETAEASVATAILLELAEHYERDTATHMARSIYDRLLADTAK